MSHYEGPRFVSTWPNPNPGFVPVSMNPDDPLDALCEPCRLAWHEREGWEQVDGLCTYCGEGEANDAQFEAMS